MFSQHPDIAKRWVAEAHRNGTPVVADMDLTEYRRQLAAAYHEMTKKPAAQQYGDEQLSSSGPFGNSGSGDVSANPAPVVVQPVSPGGGTEAPAPPQVPVASGAGQNFSPATISSEPVASVDPMMSVDEGNVSKSSLVKPGESKAGGKSEEKLATPSYDRSLIPPARAVSIAAHETPTVDPSRIAQLDQDQQRIIGAQNEMGQAQDQAVRAQADAAQQKSQLIAEQQADMLRKAQERDAYLQRQEQHITELSNDVAKEKVDPWKNKTGWDRARYAIAAALGGFVSGFRGTPNYAMQEINTQLNREMEIQREEIERKKGRIGDAQGVLANAYRRFGNLDQAEAAARAVALQQLDAEQQAWAARNGDPVQLAKSKLLSQQMRLDADKYKASLFQYRPAQTVQTGGITAAQQKELGEKAFAIRQAAAANGHDITPEEARRQAAATMGFTTGSGYADISKAPKGGNVSQKDAENLRAHEAAISYIDKMIEMRKANNGGSFSPTDKKVAAGYAARAQENLVAALGKTNKGLLDRTEKLIPDDPLEHNASGIVGADPTMAQLEAAKAMLQEEQARITAQPGTPGTAGSEDAVQVTPESDEE